MLADLLNDHRTGQDATQLGSFVLGGNTPWGTYKQALRELYKRVRGLRQMVTDRDLLLIDIEELSDQAIGNDRDARRAAIRLRAKRGCLEEADRCIADTKREAALFVSVARELKAQLGEITEERRRTLDREEWRWWHLKRVACQGRDEVTMKNLMSLPTAERNEWLSAMRDPAVMASVVERSEFGRDAPILPSADAVAAIETAIAQDPTP